MDMTVGLASVREIASQVLEHLLHRVETTPAIDEPFSHIYLEEVIPPGLYEQALSQLPAPEAYSSAADSAIRSDEKSAVAALSALVNEV